MADERRSLPGSRLLLSLVAAAALLAAGCSSLPAGTKPSGAVKNQAAAYVQQGNSYFEQGNLAQAERFFKLALDADFSIDYNLGIGSCYNSLGRVYLSAGNPKEAGSAFDHAEQYARSSGQPGSAAIVLAAQTGKAEILLEASDYAAALRTLEAAERLPVAEESIEKAALYHDIGAAYKGLERYGDALAYLDRALALHQKLSRPALEASDLYMIASVYSRQGRYGAANEYALRALARDKFVENRVGIGSDLFALGVINEKQEKLKQSYDYYYSSLQVYRTLGLVPQTAQLLERLANLSLRLGMRAQAAEYADALKQLKQAEASK